MSATDSSLVTACSKVQFSLMVSVLLSFCRLGCSKQVSDRLKTRWCSLVSLGPLPFSRMCPVSKRLVFLFKKVSGYSLRSGSITLESSPSAL